MYFQTVMVIIALLMALEILILGKRFDDFVRHYILTTVYVRLADFESLGQFLRWMSKCFGGLLRLIKFDLASIRGILAGTVLVYLLYCCTAYIRAGSVSQSVLRMSAGFTVNVPEAEFLDLHPPSKQLTDNPNVRDGAIMLFREQAEEHAPIDPTAYFAWREKTSVAARYGRPTISADAWIFDLISLAVGLACALLSWEITRQISQRIVTSRSVSRIATLWCIDLAASIALAVLAVSATLVVGRSVGLGGTYDWHWIQLCGLTMSMEVAIAQVAPALIHLSVGVCCLTLVILEVVRWLALHILDTIDSASRVCAAAITSVAAIVTMVEWLSR